MSDVKNEDPNTQNPTIVGVSPHKEAGSISSELIKPSEVTHKIDAELSQMHVEEVADPNTQIKISQNVPPPMVVTSHETSVDNAPMSEQKALAESRNPNKGNARVWLGGIIAKAFRKMRAKTAQNPI